MNIISVLMKYFLVLCKSKIDYFFVYIYTLKYSYTIKNDLLLW